MFSAIVNWCGQNPVWFSLILFVLACVISIFSNDIREFLREGVPRTRAAYARSMATARLQTLKTLHNDAYQLNLYFYNTVVTVLLGGFILSWFIGGFLNFAERQPSFQHQPSFFIPNPFSLYMHALYVGKSVIPGLIVGALLEMRGVFYRLRNYERSVKRLERVIAMNTPQPQRKIAVEQER